MIDPERIQRLAEKLGNRNDSLEFVRQMRCGGKKYPGGGKFFRTNLQNESPLMYEPMMPSVPDVPVPVRYEPEPHLGLYEYPSTTGMAESYPVTLPQRVPVAVSRNVSAPVVEEAPVENLFSDEAIARRALKQRYAESAFNDKAKSHAGAQGAWQIMPITLKDYLGRGRGKAGDLNDPEYNRKVRDWVMGIIPRDLKEFWSDSDSDRSKLAKLYAAYNWGAGNLRSFLRKKRDAGIDISNPDNWVNDLNPETRRYVKYLAFDEDIPDSIYTNSAFEDAARARGYMAEGGRLYANGGPEDDGIHLGELQPAIKLAEEPLFVDTPYSADDFFKRWYPDRSEQLAGNMAKILMDRSAWPFGTKRRARKSVDGYTQSMLRNMDENLKEYSLIASIWDRAYPHNSMYDPNRKWKFSDALKDNEARKVLDEHIQAKNEVLRNHGIKTNDEIDDNARRGEAWDNYGFSYSNDPYHIFYSSAWPSNGTIVHERTHTLRPLPGEYEKYSTYYGLTPMEYATNKIEQWNDNLLTEVGKNKDDKSYYTSPKEIVARLNELRFNLGLNPKRVITLDDLKEIRKRASESEREDFLDLYTDETLLRFFNEIADAGEQESLYGNHVGNISANGGNLFRAGGPGSITGISPINMLVPFVDKAIEKVSNGDTAENVAKLYHDNADKIPPVLHRTIYDTIKDSAFEYNPLSEIKYNFFPNLYNNLRSKVDAFDNLFLMSPEQQEKQLSSLGAIKVDTSDGYGLVNDAVTRYRERTGRDVPIYQIGEDEITRDKLIPLNNDILARYFPTVNKVYRVVHDRDVGDIEYTYPFDQVSMGDIGAAPFRLYRDTDGNIYYKRWDFFDHGSSSRGHLDPDGQYYITKPLSSASEQYGDLLDMAGNPFVKTTGYTKVPDMQEALETLNGVAEERANAGYPDVGPFYNGIFERVKAGEFDVKASGGKIHIKPENRGKFTALKKRTGHSASWFKAHGTPAQKKMAVFALNAKKWKHGDGGPLDKYGDDVVRAALLKLKANKFEDGGEKAEGNKSFMRIPITVPNMNGSSSTAASFLRDIPMTERTLTGFTPDNSGDDILRAELMARRSGGVDSPLGFLYMKSNPLGVLASYLGAKGEANVYDHRQTPKEYLDARPFTTNYTGVGDLDYRFDGSVEGGRNYLKTSGFTRNYKNDFVSALFNGETPLEELGVSPIDSAGFDMYRKVLLKTNSPAIGDKFRGYTISPETLDFVDELNSSVMSGNYIQKPVLLGDHGERKWKLGDTEYYYDAGNHNYIEVERNGKKYRKYLDVFDTTGTIKRGLAGRMNKYLSSYEIPYVVSTPWVEVQ